MRHWSASLIAVVVNAIDLQFGEPVTSHVAGDAGKLVILHGGAQ